MSRALRPYQADALAALRQSLGKGKRRPLVQAPTEEWRAVVGFEGLYEVSNLGRVRSLPRELVQPSRWGGEQRRQWRGGVLTPTVDGGKYAYGRLQVKLCKGSKRDQRTRLVHHLVAEAFLGPRPEGMEVAHADGDAANNHVSNLRYATPAENSADKHRHGTVVAGERVAGAKLSEAAVRAIRAARGIETGSRVAARFGISAAQVSRIQTGQQWRGAR